VKCFETLQRELDAARARIAELEHPRSYLPPGVERAEAVYAADVLKAEERGATWAIERHCYGLTVEARAEYARTICRDARANLAR